MTRPSRRAWIWMVSIAAVVSAAVAPSRAADVSGYRLTTEVELRDSSHQQQIERVWSTGKPGRFQGQRGLQLAYVAFVQGDRATEKGAIVIVNGRTETILKYKELIFDLWTNGYSVYAYDHRGQGLSDREPEVEKTPQRGYVHDFHDFVADLDTFVREHAKPGNHANHFLLAHSMGGAIASLYLERPQGQAVRFQAAAMSSPMHKVRGLGGMSGDVFTGRVARFLTARGRQTEYVAFGGDYDPADFEKNQYTNSRIRYERLLAENDRNPAVKLGSATHGWYARAGEAAADAREQARNVKIPVLLFQGGADKIVHPSGHATFCANLPKTLNGCDGKGGGPIVIEGARHELFIETDAIRNDQVLVAILKFFGRHRKS